MHALMLLSGSPAPPGARPSTTAAASERTSIGSPSGVPLACASTSASSAGSTAAAASARRKSSRCACPLGAVRLALFPSWPTAPPSTTGESTRDDLAPAAKLPADSSAQARHASARA